MRPITGWKHVYWLKTQWINQGAVTMIVEYAAYFAWRSPPRELQWMLSTLFNPNKSKNVFPSDLIFGWLLQDGKMKRNLKTKRETHAWIWTIKEQSCQNSFRDHQRDGHWMCLPVKLAVTVTQQNSNNISITKRNKALQLMIWGW